MLVACRKCSVDQPLTNFPKVAGCKDGHAWTCKTCALKYNEVKNPRSNRPREIAKQRLANGLKQCCKCEEIKPLSEYHKNNRWGGYRPQCKTCVKASWQNWKNGNREHLAQYNKEYKKRPATLTKVQSARRARTQASPRIVMQITLRHGLRRRYTENPATIEDLMAMWCAKDGRCAVTGIVMTWARGEVLPTSISLDRIDPDGGYSADNLRLVCQCVNAFKGRMTDAEMLTMAKAIVARAEQSGPSWKSFPAFTNDSAFIVMQ